MRQHLVVLCLAPALFVAGCTHDISSDRRSPYSVGQVARVEQGVVESYRYVEVQTETGVGTATGVVAGAAIGSTAGDGVGGVLGAIAGALIGGAIGRDVDESVGRKKAYEYQILLDNGHRVSLVQADARPIPVGAPVTLHYGRDRSRIFLDETRIVYDDAPHQREIDPSADDLQGKH